MLSFLSAFFLSCRCSEPHKRCSFIFLLVCFSSGCILKNEVLLGWGNLTVSLTFVCVMVTYLTPEQGVRDCGVWFFLLLFFEIFIDFWLCCAVSSAGEWGLLSSCGAQASFCSAFSLVAEHGLQSAGSVAKAYSPHGMWDLPGPGIEPVSLALAGGFLTTGPPGKPRDCGFDPRLECDS